MWGKIAAGAGALLAFALAAFLGHALIRAYGAAERGAGRAEAEAAQLPAILATHEAAAHADLTARAKIIASQQNSADELARILPLIVAANDKVTTYAKSDAGRAPCLSADRVRGIEADRAALFPTSRDLAGDNAGPLPAIAIADAIRPQPQ